MYQTYHTNNFKMTITLFQFGCNSCSMILKMRPQRDVKMRMIQEIYLIYTFVFSNLHFPHHKITIRVQREAKKCIFKRIFQKWSFPVRLMGYRKLNFDIYAVFLIVHSMTTNLCAIKDSLCSNMRRHILIISCIYNNLLLHWTYNLNKE